MVVRIWVRAKLLPFSGPLSTVKITERLSGRGNSSSAGGKRSGTVEASARAKEGMGEITMVSSVRRFTSTKVVRPHLVQRNCTFACLARISSFNMCCWPQCIQPVCILQTYHAYWPASAAPSPALQQGLPGQAATGETLPVLRYEIRNHAGERQCLNTFHVKN